MVNVVVLFVGDKPKGIWKEHEVVSYKGNVWWDYIKPITITESDWVRLDVKSISQKYC